MNIKWWLALPETNIAHENPIFPGKYHQNDGFSMAMLVSGSVYLTKKQWWHQQLQKTTTIKPLSAIPHQDPLLYHYFPKLRDDRPTPVVSQPNRSLKNKKETGETTNLNLSRGWLTSAKYLKNIKKCYRFVAFESCILPEAWFFFHIMIR